MNIVMKKITDLKEYENNPRYNDNAVEAVANSIKEFGFKVPIIIDKNSVIVAGHTRLKASKKLCLKEVPCIIADDLSEEQVKAFRLADNKVGEIAEWNYDFLDIELKEIENINMDLFGFDLFEEKKEVIEDDYKIEVPEEPKSKLGDIYQLGNHRLMCGDSTSIDDVEKLMNGQVADLLITDPPYNVNISNSQGMTIENDNMPEEDFKEFINAAFKNASKHLKKGGAFYIWHGDSETVKFRNACKENELTVRQCLIWVKNGFNFGRQDYKWKHEPCLYGWKDKDIDRAFSTGVSDTQLYKMAGNSIVVNCLTEIFKQLKQGGMKNV